jgi:hypothetical protein
MKLRTVAPALTAAGRLAYDNGLTSSTVSDADFEVTRLLAAEIDLRVPTIPLLRHYAAPPQSTTQYAISPAVSATFTPWQKIGSGSKRGASAFRI